MSEQITNCESKITKIINELSNGNVLDFNEYREDIEEKIQNYDFDSDGYYKDIVLSKYDKKYKKFGLIIMKYILDYDIGLNFISINPRALEFYPDELKNSKPIVLGAIQKDIRVFQFASYEIKSDKEFGLYIVNNEPSMFKYLGENLKSDKDIVLVVTNKIPYMFCYTSLELKSDIEFILRIKSQEILYYISNELYANSEFLVKAILHWELDFIEIIKNKRLSPNYPIKNEVIEEITYKLKLLYSIDVLEKEYIYLDQSNIADIYEMCIGFIN